MSDFDDIIDDESKDEDDDDQTISLDRLESIEREREHQDDPSYNEEDWGDSYDDFDSEAWEKQYHEDDEEELEPDPWDLD